MLTSFAIEPRKSPLNGLACTESPDFARLDALLTSSLLRSTFNNPFTKGFPNEAAQLAKYKESRGKIVYRRVKGMSYGRVNPVGAFGLYSIRRELRQTLAQGQYVDIDIDNCHPVLLVDLCRRVNEPCDIIADYVVNRAKWRGEVEQAYLADLTPAEAKEGSKKLFIQLMYHGNFDKWLKDQGKTRLLSARALNTFIDAFHHQIARISARIMAENPGLCAEVDARKEGKSYNRPGSIASWFFQEIECRCLEVIWEYLGVDRDCVLCADGLMVRADRVYPSLLEELSGAIYDTLGLSVKLSVKEFTQIYSDDLIAASQIAPKIAAAADDNAAECPDEKTAVERLSQLFPGRIVRASDGWYTRMPGQNYWSYGEEYVRQLIVDSNCLRKGKKVYSTTSAGCRSIFKMLEDSVRLYPYDPDFIVKINRATKGRIYVLDKYWDLAGKQFVRISDADVVPLVYLNRNAPVDYVNSHIAYDVCLNILGTPAMVRHFCRAMSRALGGFFTDKVFYLMEGVRNSGKGMLQELVRVAFGDYVATGDAPTIRSISGDAAQDARWIITSRCTVKRVLFTNEVKTKSENDQVKLDGTALKKLYASGGDPVNSRIHGGAETVVVNNTVLFMSLNENPVSNPPDAMATCQHIITPFKFVDASLAGRIPSYKLADVNLKVRIQTDDILRDSFMSLLFEGFSPSPAGMSDLPVESRERYDQLMELCQTEPGQILLDKFQVGRDFWVSNAEVKEVFAPAKRNDQLLGRFMKANGFTASRRRVDGILTHGWSGLKLKEPVDEADEPEVADPMTPPPSPPTVGLPLLNLSKLIL